MKLIYLIFLFFVQSGFAQTTIKMQGGESTVSTGGSSYNRPTFNTQTSDYTLSITDTLNVTVIMNVGSANVLTVPLNSSVAFPVGTVINVFQYGAGQTTITPTVGVTIRSAGARYRLYEQYSSAILTKIGTNEWTLVGDLNL